MEYWSIGVLEYWSIGVLEYWSVGVLECWSTAPIWNCTPRPRGWECFPGTSGFNVNPGLKPWAMVYNRFAVKTISQAQRAWTSVSSVAHQSRFTFHLSPFTFHLSPPPSHSACFEDI
jgi:hypothetical protein